MRSAFPHCYRSKDRHGRERWLLRVPGRKAVTINGRYGSPEFAENYRAALAPVEKKGIGVPRQGTIAALARAYLASAHFAGLASETRRHKRRAIETFAKDYGDYPVDGLQSKHVRKVIEGSPGRARTLLGAISALMTYAVDMGWRDENPCRGVKRPKLSKDGWHSWTDEEIATYRARHNNGTMARLALELALCSIQRRSDLVLLGRQHVQRRTPHRHPTEDWKSGLCRNRRRARGCIHTDSASHLLSDTRWRTIHGRWSYPIFQTPL